MVHSINIEYDWSEEYNFLFISDIHFDNPKCNRGLFFRHLDEARAKKARVFIFGDLLCLMQGKYDKRSSKSAVRPEHQTDTYLDTVIEDTAYHLMPYAEHIELITDGNH